MADANGIRSVPTSEILWSKPDDAGPAIKRVSLEEYEKDKQKPEAEQFKNSLTHPDLNTLKIRGANYLKGKKKIVPTMPAFRAVELKAFAYNGKILHVAQRLADVRNFLAEHPNREFLVINRILPTQPWYNVVTIWEREQGSELDPIFESLWSKFKAGDDDFRNRRLKYICQIPNAGWFIRTSVATLGGFRPVILGKGYLEQYHYRGSNYTEIDVDIGSSMTARGVMRAIVPQQKKLVIDEAFVVEGQADDELPEFLLSAVRGIRVDFPTLAIPITEDMLGPMETAKPPTATTVTPNCGGLAPAGSGVAAPTGTAKSAEREVGSDQLPTATNGEPGPKQNPVTRSAASDDDDDDDDFHDASEES